MGRPVLWLAVAVALAACSMPLLGGGDDATEPMPTPAASRPVGAP